MPFCFRWRISHFGAASKASSCVCASLSLPCPVCQPAVAMGRACRSIRSFVAHLLVVPSLEFWRPGALCWSPVRFTLRQLKYSRSSLTCSRWLLSGFLPPTAGCSFIGCISACSGSLLRVTAISLAFGLATAVFRYGGGFHARVWMVACLPFLQVWRTALSHVPLMLCASTGIYFRSILASSSLSFVWIFGGLVQVFSCLDLSVPVGVRSGFAPADFSSLWLCLVERI